MVEKLASSKNTKYNQHFKHKSIYKYNIPTLCVTKMCNLFTPNLQLKNIHLWQQKKKKNSARISRRTNLKEWNLDQREFYNVFYSV